MVNKFLLGVLLVAVVSGCKVDVDHEPIILEYHRYGDRPSIVEVQIQKDDSIYRFINNLLRENKSGWRPSIVNYVPCIKVRARDDMYRLNICPDRLVLMYWDAEKKYTTQVTKKISNKAYNEIVTLIEQELTELNEGVAPNKPSMLELKKL